MRLSLCLPPVLAALGMAVSGAYGADIPSLSAGWDLPRLMAGLQQVRAANAHFVERRYFSMLTQPIETSGTLAYVAPDKLRKQTLAPKPELLVVDGSNLTIEPGPEGKGRILSLEDYPQIGALVESIRATLAGDLTTLLRYFDVTLKGGPADWQLRLEPKGRRLRDFIRSIRIGGSRFEIRSVETAEGDGDRSEMSIVADRR